MTNITFSFSNEDHQKQKQKQPNFAEEQESEEEETETETENKDDNKDDESANSNANANPNSNISRKCQKLLAQLKSEPSAVQFLHAFDWKQRGLMEYPSIVQKPMDLNIIQQKSYSNCERFYADCQLMFANAIVFMHHFYKSRAENVKYYQNTIQLQAIFGTQFAEYFPDCAHSILSSTSTSKSKSPNIHILDLPTDCLTVMTGFVSKSDLTLRLKLCCSQFAIIAISEMQKYTIGVSILDKCSASKSLHNRPPRIVIHNRYRATMSNDAIFEQWSMDYQIPRKNMLLYHAFDEQGTQLRMPNKVYSILNINIHIFDHYFCLFLFFSNSEI
jgi:hypothetical protein